MLDSRMEAVAAEMREREECYDRVASRAVYLVARLDGRGFSRLTRQMGVQRPFDEGFRDSMVRKTEHLMNSGFKIVYAYTQSDEISLLFDSSDTSFTHRYRKLLSVLAGEGSACLSLAFGRPVSMDCRLLELDSKEAILDYFSWRQSDAKRNCLLSHAYWTLRRSGLSGRAAQQKIDGVDSWKRSELLFKLAGTDYALIPAWQRSGVALYYENFERVGVNPLTGENVPVTRRRIKQDLNLPLNGEYRRFLEARLAIEKSA